MLPPLPGKNTAHPAFDCKENRFLYDAAYPINGGIDMAWIWLPGEGFSRTAAAAIAHYWQRHFIAIDGRGSETTKDVITTMEQYEFWTEIAAGSREYDNWEIVEFKP